MPDVISAPQFFSLDRGPHRCFYCGAPCGDARLATTLVKSSFLDVGDVAAPLSEYVCAGCEIAMEEKTQINGRDGQRRRNYSWVLSRSGVRAYTKADVRELQDICLAPPAPPYAIVLATSGQKQLLFRARVNYDSRAVTVQLELEQVTYAVPDLRQRLIVVADLMPHLGKSRMLDGHWPLGILLKMSTTCADAESKLDAWRRVCGEPLSRLAVFLSPSAKKEE